MHSLYPKDDQNEDDGAAPEGVLPSGEVASWNWGAKDSR